MICTAHTGATHELIQSCEVKLGIVPATLAHATSRLAVRVHRGPVTYATGYERERHGKPQLLLHARRKLAPGRYTITLAARGRTRARTSATLRIGR